MGIKEKNLPVSTSISAGNFIREVTSGGLSKKIDYDKLAKAIVEEYAGSSIAGSSQSLKTALDAMGIVEDVPFTYSENVDLNYSANSCSIKKYGRIVIANYQVRVIAEPSNTRTVYIDNIYRPAATSRGNVFTSTVGDVTYGGANYNSTENKTYLYVNNLSTFSGRTVMGFAVWITRS